MDIIPIADSYAQTLRVSLNNQECRIDLRQNSTGLYLTLYVDDAVIVAGVVCRDRNPLVLSKYLGLAGDLAFVDIAGTDDPSSPGLGTRFLLCYQAAAVAVAVEPFVPYPAPAPAPAPSPPAPPPPPPPFPGTIYYNFDNAAGGTLSAGPAAMKASQVAAMTSLGTVTFETLSGGDTVNGISIPLTGGSGTVRFDVTATNPLGALIVSTPGAGRFNTTAGGANFLQSGTPAGATTAIKMTPSVTNFTAFGMYLTDPGDFLPAIYSFVVVTSTGTWTVGFDLSASVPTLGGCLAYWGFTLPSGVTLTSVSLLCQVTPTPDVVGIDDVFFGYRT